MNGDDDNAFEEPEIYHSGPVVTRSFSRAVTNILAETRKHSAVYLYEELLANLDSLAKQGHSAGRNATDRDLLAIGHHLDKMEQDWQNGVIPLDSACAAVCAMAELDLIGFTDAPTIVDSFEVSMPPYNPSSKMTAEFRLSADNDNETPVEQVFADALMGQYWLMDRKTFTQTVSDGLTGDNTAARISRSIALAQLAVLPMCPDRAEFVMTEIAKMAVSLNRTQDFRFETKAPAPQP